MNLTFNTKEQLIEALEAKRRACEAEDAENMRKHKEAERKALAAFKEMVRAAAKWDYAKAKKNSFRVGNYDSGPKCPASMIARLDRVLAFVKVSQQKRYVIGKNAHEEVFSILTIDMPKTKGLC